MKNSKFKIGNFKILAALFGKMEARDPLLVTGETISMAQAAARYGRGVALENVALAPDDGTTMVGAGLANDLKAEEEWFQITPIGEFQHPRGLQRIDKAAVEKMENSFHSVLQKLKRRFRGVPIYRGHPDVPGLANEYTDDKAYGWITDLQAREDGLYGKAEWSPEGADMVKSKHYRFPSGYWDAAVVSEVKGMKIYQPHTLLSVGLTNRPRIPVQALANSEIQQKENEMNREIIAALLGLAATATEADITTKITELRGLPTRVSALENAETTAKGEIEKANAAKKTADEKLANVAKERNRLALENAISAGRLTPAEKKEWEAKLEADYDTNAPLLEKKEKGMKTKAQLENGGSRRNGLANAQEAAKGQFTAEVKKLKASGLPAHDAWMAAKDAHPELYAAMENSEEAQD